MMKKNNLDEMQELKLLKIEHRACWIAYWGLLVTIILQMLLGNHRFENLVGEYFVFFALCIYLAIDCIRNGIWDRKLKPNFKTNLLLSIFSGTVSGLIYFVISYRNYHNLVGSIATFLFMLLFVTISCLVMLTITTKIYQMHKNKMEQDADTDENA